ncbi:MAG: hypothetical protein E7269_02620 [Lachnospiraceae bacterium]|nr:hypothetical protein [Lachnospiraceae bacterium]
MKKILSILIVLTITVTSIIPANANIAFTETTGTIVKETTEYFSDGSYIVTTISDETTGMPSTRASMYTKTGTKTHTAYNSNDEELWSFTVRGYFLVNPGIQTSCTSASYTIDITEDAWSNKSASATKSSNKAIGTATFIKKLLGVTVSTREITVTLTCDANGNLS